jgi:hypothetical protein
MNSIGFPTASSGTLIAIAWLTVLFGFATLQPSTASKAAESEKASEKTAESEKAAESKKLDRPEAHERRELEGWTVWLDARLVAAPHDDLGKRSLRLLGDRLYEIAMITPADRLAKLRAVPIWLDLNHGALKAMQYHPSAGWLKGNGYAEKLAQGVHIPVAHSFANPRHHRQQPWAVLHELAHAYHDRELSFEEPRIKAAWQRTVDAMKWREVLHIDGKAIKHYALTNQMEFFAEMSEAYFGLNDFYPFQRAELKRDEPEIHALLVEIWGALP